MDTHYAADILVVALDPDPARRYSLAIVRNGERVAESSCPTDAGLLRTLHHCFVEATASDLPLVVIVGKARLRASEGETNVVALLKAATIAEVALLPQTAPTFVAGRYEPKPNAVHYPRAAGLALPYASKGTSVKARVRAFCDGLNTNDEVLDLIPKGITYLGGAE